MEDTKTSGIGSSVGQSDGPQVEIAGSEWIRRIGSRFQRDMTIVADRMEVMERAQIGFAEPVPGDHWKAIRELQQAWEAEETRLTETRDMQRSQEKTLATHWEKLEALWSVVEVHQYLLSGTKKETTASRHEGMDLGTASNAKIEAGWAELEKDVKAGMDVCAGEQDKDDYDSYVTTDTLGMVMTELSDRLAIVEKRTSHLPRNPSGEPLADHYFSGTFLDIHAKCGALREELYRSTLSKQQRRRFDKVLGTCVSYLEDAISELGR